ncbi:hypothetical protein [Streptomyces odontomachi]|uniref:hypothetical protein n=1 Tax=Streptomyces odontomachi TaxID=2944940 RepID=UPI00210BBEA8|nr:hypothetical protein [Streptomyces sp. ODS25]
MVRKKMEGDEAQRRAAARKAERAGERPSFQGTTTGASKQRTHLGTSTEHEVKIATEHRGKQQWPYDVSGGSGPPTGPEASPFQGRGHPEYSAAHARVFETLTTAETENGGEGVYLEEIARRSGVPREQTRGLLHDLIVAHGLAAELQHPDDPDLGPRYEVKRRL